MRSGCVQRKSSPSTSARPPSRRAARASASQSSSARAVLDADDRVARRATPATRSIIAALSSDSDPQVVAAVVDRSGSRRRRSRGRRRSPARSPRARSPRPRRRAWPRRPGTAGRGRPRRRSGARVPYRSRPSVGGGLVDGVGRRPAPRRSSGAAGTTSTSWIGTCPPACLPPLKRLIVGRGRVAAAPRRAMSAKWR